MFERIPQNYLELIRQETEAAVKRGWDASHSEWRATALAILCETCLTAREFTVDYFREKIKSSGVKTHDNRAMGGLMATARNWGWIEATGEKIPNREWHGIGLRVWKSNIYQELSFREIEQERVLSQKLL